MHRFNDLSIRHKLTAIILFTSFVVLLLASILYVTSEVLTVRRIIMEELTALAEIVGSNSSAAMLFNDRHTAQENLAALRAKPNIESAHIFLADESLFARFVRNPTSDGRHLMLAPDPAAASGRMSTDLQLLDGVMTLHAPIHFDDEQIGSISIRSNLDQMYSLLNAFLGFAILVLALSLATAWVLSQWLQRIISQPVLQLLDAMQQVTRSKDYSVRAPKRRDDELGYVVDGFNAMRRARPAGRKANSWPI
jgi:sensor histidine kinase regulating citrate/malate metabolism